MKKAPDKTEEEGKARFALPKPIENDKMIEIEMERNEEEARRSKKDRQQRKKRKMEEGESSMYRRGSWVYQRSKRRSCGQRVSIIPPLCCGYY